MGSVIDNKEFTIVKKCIELHIDKKNKIVNLYFLLLNVESIAII